MALAPAERLGLPARAANKILDDVATRFEPWIDRLGELPFDTNRIVRLRRFLRERHRNLVG